MAPRASSQDGDSESINPGDPNLVGKQASAPVQDRRAGSMTPTWEFDQVEPVSGRMAGPVRDRGY